MLTFEANSMHPKIHNWRRFLGRLLNKKTARALSILFAGPHHSTSDVPVFATAQSRPGRLEPDVAVATTFTSQRRGTMVISSARHGAEASVSFSAGMVRSGGPYTGGAMPARPNLPGCVRINYLPLEFKRLMGQV